MFPTWEGSAHLLLAALPAQVLGLWFLLTQPGLFLVWSKSPHEPKTLCNLEVGDAPVRNGKQNHQTNTSTNSSPACICSEA